MSRCPSCAAVLSTENRFCAHCGTEQRPDTQSPTETSLDGPISHDSLDRARFLPGTLLAERYRIVGLLGRGGMGEVYRADDLKLGQPVALKFLPESLEQDASRMSRLLNEVRLARQVSHPNVCRVYDIDELSGSHFMAMEYVDGEDLSSLLRRIGRLPHEKALEIARQICAGLAAAHEQGILHRDLKPANVMLDGRGRVKLTDFGLAGLAEGIDDKDVRSGTPAYMAPEQLAGREVTVRSDIYSLGLLLYEIFTGKRAFSGKSVAEIARLQQQTIPTSPSSLVSGLDEIVEQVILRCLEKDPGARPMSALAVSAALPGGDPLAAALAAGETPSPEMVAEAGAAGGLRPVVAVAALIAIAFSIGLAALGTWRPIYRRVPLDTPPDELASAAMQTLTKLGIEEPGPHRRWGFDTDKKYLKWVEDTDTSMTRWDAMETGRPPAITFWYRYSSEAMIPSAVHAFFVGSNDPPQHSRGQGRLRLDLQGRLLELDIVSSHAIETSEKPVEWSALFDAAGFDLAEFKATDPVRGPSSPCGELQAWTGPIHAGMEGTVQACRLGGSPTYFEILAPWHVEAPEQESGGAVGVIFALIFMGMLTGAIVLARRNLRAGRSDRRGAVKVMIFFIVTILGTWLLVEVRLGTFSAGELYRQIVFGRLLAHGLLHAVFVGFLYLGLEPYVRRLWPETLVSWSRLLLGRFRDPLVGRDLLLGMAAIGFLMQSWAWIYAHVTRLLEIPPELSRVADPMLAGVRYSLAVLLEQLQWAVGGSMLLLVLLLLLRLLLRRTWAVIAVSLILATLLGLGAPGSFPMGWRIMMAFMWTLLAATVVLCMLRLGLLSVIGGVFLMGVLAHAPLTTDLSQWYAAPALVSVIGVLAVALWAFYISLAGRKLLRDSVLGEG